MAAQVFVDLWQSGGCDAQAHASLDTILASCLLSGRMTHGIANTPGFGVLLISDEWKQLSWAFGPETLQHLLGKNARQVSLFLGSGEQWLDKNYKKENYKKENIQIPFVFSISIASGMGQTPTLAAEALFKTF